MYLHYAKPYLLPAIVLTAIAWWFTYLRGPAALSLLGSFKLATNIIGIFALRQLRRKEIYFYRNIGYDERDLLLRTGLVDLTVCLVGMTIILQIVY